MKGFKKLLTGILAGAMALTMALSTGSAAKVQAAEATQEKGSITISNARNHQEYNIYRVFDFTPADDFNKESDGKIHGVYTLSDKFAGLAGYEFSYTDDEGKATSVEMSKFFTIGDNQILNTKGIATEDDAKLFGKAVLSYVAEKGVTADGNQTANAGEGAADDATVEIKFTGLEYGYYVVDSSLGSAVSVDTTVPNAAIAEKNDVPGLDKKITGKASSETTYTDLTGNNAQIGDIITFEVTAELRVGGTNYSIVDEMTDGLTFKEIVSVKAGNENYAYASLTTTEHGFVMAFDEPKADAKVVVTYTAQVNKDAVLNPDENVNEAYLTYGHTATPKKKTITKTYPMQIKKIDSLDDTKVLEGAHFNVYRKVDNSLVKFTVSEDGLTYSVDPNGTVTDVVTVKDTPLTLNGFDAAVYVLVETQAPAGYNLLVAKDNATYTLPDGTTTTHFQEVTVSESSTVKNPTVAEVINSSGITLPSTGGIGTTIFYIVGGILIVAGIAYFILRRKADAE